LRTADPTSGKWEEYATMKGGYGDPDIFFDDDGKLYMLSGLGEANIVELNPKDFSEIKGTKTQLTPHYKTAEEFVAANTPYGLFTGHETYNHVDWNKPGALDTTPIIGKSRQPPTQEGTWLTKYNGRYYLQDSSPDTSCPWYSDVVYESDKILGPYTLCDYAPASMKVGGFINSTGHSCVFQDRYGNYWRVTTMWVGAFTGFERRIGLFPVGFDAKGRMFTQTALGDYPMVMPAGKYDPNRQSPLAGWFVLSTGKTCSASSTLKQHEPAGAADENVRTWWSAESGNPGEWFQMDLGKICVIDAMQINFAEQDCKNEPVADDFTAYQLLISADGKNWKSVVDKSSNTTAVPHDYVSLAAPETARYLKVVNVHVAKDGKFALRDLRVFGNGQGAPPAAVVNLTVKRGDDARNITFSWTPSPHADGYVIHYGVAPDALHLNLQYQGGSMNHLTVSCLNREVKYFYRIDAYDDSGITTGSETTAAQ
jgi:xylan 1,4-beta-xylosidase